MNVIALALFRIAAVLWLTATGLFLVVGWPWSGIAVGLLVWSRIRNGGQSRLTTLGSARWADERDLERTGMFQADAGLILGRHYRQGGLWTALLQLFRRWPNAATACREFFLSWRRESGRIVRLPQAIHTIVVAPSGAGKGVSFVVPFLRTCREACVVVDFKGELARLSAEHRRRQFGHECILLDPYRVVTENSDCYNVLDEITTASPTAIDDCNDLAKSLVVRPPEERDPHWNDAAELWISSMAATVVRYGEFGATRSFQTVRDFLSQPDRLDAAVRLMCESDAWDGCLSRMGGQLRHFVDREKSSTLSTVSRHLRFLDTPALVEHTARSTFDPLRLRQGRMTIYLILPPEHMRAQSGLLRMWIGGLLRTAVRGGLQESNKIHFVIDEAASLGRLEAIDDAIQQYRGYGVRLQLYYQSLGQLKKTFPEGQEQTLLSNASQVYFGVNDTATADLVSARLGETTIVTDSGSSSYGGSRQSTYGMSPSESSGSSWNTTSSWQQTARKLLKPEEIIQLDPRTAITFTPGMPPIGTRLLRYYEEPQLGRLRTRREEMLESVRHLLLGITLVTASGSVLGLLLFGIRILASP